MHTMFEFAQPSDTIEFRQLGESVRRFSEEHLDHGKFRRADFELMGNLGISGMTLKSDFGGTESPPLDCALVSFELARVELGAAIYNSVHQMVSKLVQTWSTNSSQTELLADFAAAKKLCAFCLTEPSAGSDASSLQTKAEKTSSGWMLNGEKIYISSGGVADFYLVFARTGEIGKKGISAFLLDSNTEGLSFGAEEKKMGCNGSTLTSVSFNNCKVDNNALVGETGLGYKIALSGLNGGRVNVAAAACGLASKALFLASNYLRERKQFGRPLSEFQGLQFMLADMSVQLRAAILLTRDAAVGLEKASDSNWPASIAKCFATDSAMSITTDAVQLFGGAGYLEEYGVEKLMRDAKVLQILEGTNQIQRMLIARSILTDDV